MKVEIQKINREKEEQVLIRCYEINQEVSEIARFANSRQEGVEVYSDKGFKVIPLAEIYYVEAVDNHVFAYLKHQVYEVKSRLYEFEQLHGDKQFFRCSKATIVNLMKMQSLKPALNGRFTAVLTNGESVIISRKFVPDLKLKLQGGQTNE